MSSDGSKAVGISCPMSARKLAVPIPATSGDHHDSASLRGGLSSGLLAVGGSSIGSVIMFGGVRKAGSDWAGVAIAIDEGEGDGAVGELGGLVEVVGPEPRCPSVVLTMSRRR